MFSVSVKYRVTMCWHGLPYMGKATKPSRLCGLEQEDPSLPTLEFLTNLEGL